ncbi:hypothetical protein [Victivallis vadensis]|uniref:hypothetical protein n=1 Tax=Victivallis vadensis TaxID=172901 RepID=UPI00349FD4A7
MLVLGGSGLHVLQERSYPIYPGDVFPIQPRQIVAGLLCVLRERSAAGRARPLQKPADAGGGAVQPGARTDAQDAARTAAAGPRLGADVPAAFPAVDAADLPHFLQK